MSELLITQCPHCQTRFRLTPAQLSVAAGHVRCGACLEVFHAADAAAGLSQSDTPGNTEQTDKPPSPPQPPRPSPGSVRQNDLDEPDLAALGLDESIVHEVNPDIAAGPVSSEAQPPAPELHEDFLSTPPARDFGPTFDHQRIGLDQVLPDQSVSADSTTPPRDQAEESTAAEALEEVRQPAVPASTTAASAAADELPVSDEHLPGGDDDRLEPAVTPLGLELLEEELLQQEQAPARRPSRSWLWSSLALLALLALPTQYLFYNFDALARDRRSRPVLENICLLVRCELPARVDISRIRSTNLLVRPHPEYPNALAIDVILYNRADFAQPFPVLEMQFADATGQPLASRRFRPEEYLSGELAGVDLMPSQTPIHVGLSMLDPGEQARSYRLEFRSP